MRADDGYTLGECLVALFVISLAIGGLSAGTMTIGKLQAQAGRLAADDRIVRGAQERMTRLLEGAGPFPSVGDSFQGAADGFRFDCGAELEKGGCRVWLSPGAGGLTLHTSGPRQVSNSLLLPGVRSAQFVYAGTRTIGPVWPSGTTDIQA